MLRAEFPCNEHPSFLSDKESAPQVHCINSRLIGRSKCTWFCNFDVHRGYLTEDLLKEHDCIKKSCIYLYRVIKEKNDRSKDIRKKRAALKKQTEAKNSDILKRACTLSEDMDGLKIIRVESKGPYDIVVYFVAIGSFDLTQIVKQLESEFELYVAFVELEYDFDRVAEIIINGKGI